MSYYVNINRSVISRNTMYGQDEPPISVRKGKSGKAVYAHEVDIKDGRLIYSPHKPILKCGARLVIVTDTEPKVIR